MVGLAHNMQTAISAINTVYLQVHISKVMFTYKLPTVQSGPGPLVRIITLKIADFEFFTLTV